MSRTRYSYIQIGSSRAQLETFDPGKTPGKAPASRACNGGCITRWTSRLFTVSVPAMFSVNGSRMPLLVAALFSLTAHYGSSNPVSRSANVTLTNQPTHVVLDNGILTVDVEKNSGNILGIT